MPEQLTALGEYVTIFVEDGFSTTRGKKMDALVISILGGLARAGLAAAGGYLVKKGFDDGGVIAQVSGWSSVGVAAGWSWFNKVVFHRDVQFAAVTGTNPLKH